MYLKLGVGLDSGEDGGHGKRPLYGDGVSAADDIGVDGHCTADPSRQANLTRKKK